MTRRPRSRAGPRLFSAGYARDAANRWPATPRRLRPTAPTSTPRSTSSVTPARAAPPPATSPPTGSIPYTYDAGRQPDQEGHRLPGLQQRRRALLDRFQLSCLRQPALGQDHLHVRHSGQPHRRHSHHRPGPDTDLRPGQPADQVRRRHHHQLRLQRRRPAHVQVRRQLLPTLFGRGHSAVPVGCGRLPAPPAQRWNNELRIRSRRATARADQWKHHSVVSPRPARLHSPGHQLNRGVAGDIYYDPYGGLASSTGSITNPFRFTGAYETPSRAFCT